MSRGVGGWAYGARRAVEELFYARFCHGVLWPLFHCIPMMTSLTKFEEGEESSAAFGRHLSRMMS